MGLCVECEMWPPGTQTSWCPKGFMKAILSGVARGLFPSRCGSPTLPGVLRAVFPAMCGSPTLPGATPRQGLAP